MKIIPPKILLLMLKCQLDYSSVGETRRKENFARIDYVVELNNRALW